ncbi:MAG: T9SS type A sorting domain-containing protein, partial [Ferruginibacter sp.]|nr:T9SS type A sorting domain-containing protein [Ferruginibacter sp.]
TTNVQPLAFTTALQNITAGANIDLLGVQPGIHQLYARVFTTNNIESIVNVGQFAMEQNFRYANVAASAPALQNMEYYIDVDPGYGLATVISISGANIIEVLNNINISIPNNLTAGTHFLHIRSKQNPWSIDNAIPFNVAIVVPVTWLYVKAQLLNNNSLIQWATANELNSKLYEVEWSTNGINFIKIGSVNAAGNTSSNSNYNFTHDKPANGFNYYRLKQIDIDGKFKYSDIVKVLRQQNNAISIYPNPTTNYIQLEFASNKKTLVQIFDAQGKQVIIIHTANQTLLKIDIAALAKGNYILQASDGEVWYTGSFIKQ